MAFAKGDDLGKKAVREAIKEAQQQEAARRKLIAEQAKRPDQATLFAEELKKQGLKGSMGPCPERK